MIKNFCVYAPVLTQLLSNMCFEVSFKKLICEFMAKKFQHFLFSVSVICCYNKQVAFSQNLFNIHIMHVCT